VDAMALCDADLGTLAVDPRRYKSYRKPSVRSSPPSRHGTTWRPGSRS
jgi:hypothetical protein